MQHDNTGAFLNSSCVTYSTTTTITGAVSDESHHVVKPQIAVYIYIPRHRNSNTQQCCCKLFFISEPVKWLQTLNTSSVLWASVYMHKHAYTHTLYINAVLMFWLPQCILSLNIVFFRDSCTSPLFIWARN